MRLTLFTDYGLRTLVRLAGDPDGTFTVGGLADEFQISRNHLVKVVRELVAAGFVETRRGAGGGLALALPAGEISLGRVVRALEQRHALVECFRDDGGACTLTPDCRLKGRLAAAREAFYASLDQTTVAACAWRPARRRGASGSPAR